MVDVNVVSVLFGCVNFVMVLNRFCVYIFGFFVGVKLFRNQVFIF